MRIFGDLSSPSRWSVRTRVTAIATLFVALLLAAGAAIFYQVVRSAVYDGLHKQGTSAAADLSTLVGTSDPRGRLRVEDPEFTLLQVVSDDGVVLAASGQLEGRGPLDVSVPRAPRDPAHRVVQVPDNGAVYLVTERVRSPGGWRIVHVGAPIRTFTQYRGQFMGLLIGVVLIGTAAVGYIVSLAVRRALRPVREMSAELAEITGRAPDRRVSVPHPNDEVSELAESVNVTLSRLEDVLDRQRGFVADVSHELRSPLTGLRTQLELALEQPEDEDWPAVARAALADADRLQGIVSDLLILAKLGAGVHVGRERVDLGALVRAEVTQHERRVPVEVETTEGAMVRATPHHLVRVLTNLVENAQRHAASRIWVTVAVSESHAVLEVLDDGAGIAPEDRERIFWRFHRLRESRELDQGGTGLGLTISRDIARAHGGTLVAADSDRGARFVLRIPLDEP
ncbi:sensor histidine kinase [Actinomadura livida]|uniref:histidine kinase n=1 Tax=Actinomadura livida TaxID=79909 RepID=A0A7W7IAU0_9ACTN|nr:MULTISPECIES: ATP-binding protein [Actinomadura]MBB4773711.1 signal transduction histidine kinase [Actinomadura catellatispora]GGU10211.1 two-component sensor histidine kinase [Actinomadura livida]